VKFIIYLKEQFFVYLMVVVAALIGYWLAGGTRNALPFSTLVSMSLVFIFGGALYKYLSQDKTK
jgi:hypothetical protein